MEAAFARVLVTGSYNSALFETVWSSGRPPAINTLPDGSSVAE